jgi:hypothetical protein
MVEISKLLFISSFDDNFDLTNAKISNAELDEQLKLFVIFKCKSVIVVTKY